MNKAAFSIDKQDLLSRIDFLAVLQDLLPGGTVKSNEYHHLCPFHEDHRVGNASTNTDNGHGKCQSCGAGWDVFKLYMHLTSTTSFHGALQAMAERFTGAATSTPRPTSSRPAAPAKDDGLVIVMPIPKSAPAAPAAQLHYGRPTMLWTYRDHAGEVLGHVCRFDRPEKRKEILPLTLWRDSAGLLVWKWRHFPEQRPLYGIDRLQRIIDMTPAGGPVQILFFEGEKAADAGHALVGNRYACLTWPAGSNGIEDKGHQCKIDLTPCRGHHCTIWPDNDIPGLKAADTLARHLRHAGAASVEILTPPTEKAEGWDIADGKAEGWTAEQLIGHIANAKRIKVAINPDGCAAAPIPAPMGGPDKELGQTVAPLFDLSRLTLGSDIAAGDYQLSYVVDKLIPEQAVILFYAKGGAGKSTLATQIAGAVVNGLPFMGLTTVKRPVVIIDFENPNAVLKRRIKAVAGSDQVYFWTGSNSPPQLNKKDWVVLKDMAMTLDNPLIFIDTLSSSTSGLDILSNGDYAKVMSKILELRNLGSTIVLLHHTPKGDATQYIGASVIYNQCDHILAMYPVKAPGAEKEAVDEDEAKTYRLGTKDKTRFEPFNMFIEFGSSLFGVGNAC